MADIKRRAFIQALGATFGAGLVTTATDTTAGATTPEVDRLSDIPEWDRAALTDELVLGYERRVPDDELQRIIDATYDRGSCLQDDLECDLAVEVKRLRRWLRDTLDSRQLFPDYPAEGRRDFVHHRKAQS